MNRKQQLLRVHALAEEIRLKVRTGENPVEIKSLMGLLDMEIKIAKPDLYLEDASESIEIGDEVKKTIQAVLGNPD